MYDKISKRNLNRIGKLIRLRHNDEEYLAAIAILNRWREQHILPMDYYFDVCNDISASSAYKGTVVAERLKRLPTIIDKLDRFPHMHLYDMQDIGGVRVILKDVQHLMSFDEEVCMLPTLKSSKDYLTKPKASGYRGRHLIFKYENMLIEVQLRTHLEHLWATSVETVDIIRGTSLKTTHSNSYWQKFFELASSAFAYIEDLPMLPQHRNWGISRLCDEIKTMMEKYPIENSLETFATTYDVVKNHEHGEDSYYAVVTFNSRNNETVVAYYSEDQYQDAVHRYEELEKVAYNNNVLVSVSDLKKLRDAYPNYFKDISMFRDIIKSMLDFQVK